MVAQWWNRCLLILLNGLRTFKTFSTHQKQYLSDYQKQFNQRETETEKLMETQFNNVNYRCHNSVLKSYVQQGMRVTKLRKTLQFHHSSFLKPYIDLNTTKRQEPRNSRFKKKFFKLRWSTPVLLKPWKIWDVGNAWSWLQRKSKQSFNVLSLTSNGSKYSKMTSLLQKTQKKLFFGTNLCMLVQLSWMYENSKCTNFISRKWFPCMEKTLGFFTRTLIQSSIILKLKMCIKIWKEWKIFCIWSHIHKIKLLFSNQNKSSSTTNRWVKWKRCFGSCFSETRDLLHCIHWRIRDQIKTKR